MILVSINEPNFEYDIHSLVQAFYPGREVLVRVFSPEDLRARAAEAEFILVITFGEDSIGFALYPGKNLPGPTRTAEAADPAHAAEAADPARTAEAAGSVRIAAAEYPSRPTEAAEAAADRDSDAAQAASLFERQVEVNPNDRRGTRNRLKQTLYRLLSDYSGRTLPWGTLTGIRPVKIPMDMLEKGSSEDDIREYMRETYFAADEKIYLATEIAERERGILSSIDYENGYSLYIGIPFCPSTCLYCSFTSFPIEAWRDRVENYLDALCREIRETAPMMEGRHLDSVYIGGGTPTSIAPEQIDRLLEQIGESFHISGSDGRIIYGGYFDPQGSVDPQGLVDPQDPVDLQGSADPQGPVNPQGPLPHPANRLMEFTVEAGRPDSITPEKLKVLADRGVSRISINPQTMNEPTLRLIGRSHTVEQIREAFALAREMGFDNINMDLIAGLPDETIDDVRRTMDEIEALGPDSVTVHSLAVKRAARLRTEHEQYEHLHIENTWDIIRLTAERCRGMGLFPYYLYRQKNTAGNFENVGYAAPGKEGIYNILIMEEKQTILALGAGATTKAVFDHGERIERVGNVKDAGIYIDRVDQMIERKRNFFGKYGRK